MLFFYNWVLQEPATNGHLSNGFFCFNFCIGFLGVTACCVCFAAPLHSMVCCYNAPKRYYLNENSHRCHVMSWHMSFCQWVSTVKVDPLNSFKFSSVSVFVCGFFLATYSQTAALILCEPVEVYRADCYLLLCPFDIDQFLWWLHL